MCNIYVSVKPKNVIPERYIVKLRETNMSRSGGTKSNEEKAVRFSYRASSSMQLDSRW